MNGIKCFSLLPYLWLQRYSVNKSSSSQLIKPLSPTCEPFISPPLIQFKSSSPSSFPSSIPTEATITGNMESIKDVDIDGRGKFKYIQIKVEDNVGGEKLIIRGFSDCGYHADILERVQSQLPNYRCDSPGGGRILHEPDKKKILVYGYSMGFGRADHQVTVDLLKKSYPDYTIEWSNEGY